MLQRSLSLTEDENQASIYNVSDAYFKDSGPNIAVASLIEDDFEVEMYNSGEVEVQVVEVAEEDHYDSESELDSDEEEFIDEVQPSCVSLYSEIKTSHLSSEEDEPDHEQDLLFVVKSNPIAPSSNNRMVNSILFPNALYTGVDLCSVLPFPSLPHSSINDKHQSTLSNLAFIRSLRAFRDLVDLVVCESQRQEGGLLDDESSVLGCSHCHSSLYTHSPVEAWDTLIEGLAPTGRLFALHLAESISLERGCSMAVLVQGERSNSPLLLCSDCIATLLAHVTEHHTHTQALFRSSVSLCVQPLVHSILSNDPHPPASFRPIPGTQGDVFVARNLLFTVLLPSFSGGMLQLEGDCDLVDAETVAVKAVKDNMRLCAWASTRTHSMVHVPLQAVVSQMGINILVTAVFPLSSSPSTSSSPASRLQSTAIRQSLSVSSLPHTCSATGISAACEACGCDLMIGRYKCADDREYITDLSSVIVKDPLHAYDNALLSEQQCLARVHASVHRGMRLLMGCETEGSVAVGGEGKTMSVHTRSLRPELLARYSHTVLPSVYPASDDEESLRTRLGVHLVETVVPAVVSKLDSGEFVPSDGDSLCAFLHAHGVNLHFLGLVAQSTKSLSVFRLCVVEMVARTLKSLHSSSCKGVISRHAGRCRQLKSLCRDLGDTEPTVESNDASVHVVGVKKGVSTYLFARNMQRPSLPQNEENITNLQPLLIEAFVDMLNQTFGSTHDNSNNTSAIEAFWSGILGPALNFKFGFDVLESECRWFEMRDSVSTTGSSDKPTVTVSPRSYIPLQQLLVRVQQQCGVLLKDGGPQTYVLHNRWASESNNVSANTADTTTNTVFSAAMVHTVVPRIKTYHSAPSVLDVVQDSDVTVLSKDRVATVLSQSTHMNPVKRRFAILHHLASSGQYTPQHIALMQTCSPTLLQLPTTVPLRVLPPLSSCAIAVINHRGATNTRRPLWKIMQAEGTVMNLTSHFSMALLLHALNLAVSHSHNRLNTQILTSQKLVKLLSAGDSINSYLRLHHKHYTGVGSHSALGENKKVSLSASQHNFVEGVYRLLLKESQSNILPLSRTNTNTDTDTSGSTTGVGSDVWATSADINAGAAAMEMVNAISAHNGVLSQHINAVLNGYYLHAHTPADLTTSSNEGNRPSFLLSLRATSLVSALTKVFKTTSSSPVSGLSSSTMLVDDSLSDITLQYACGCVAVAVSALSLYTQTRLQHTHTPHAHWGALHTLVLDSVSADLGANKPADTHAVAKLSEVIASHRGLADTPNSSGVGVCALVLAFIRYSLFQAYVVCSSLTHFGSTPTATHVALTTVQSVCLSMLNQVNEIEVGRECEEILNKCVKANAKPRSNTHTLTSLDTTSLLLAALPLPALPEALLSPREMTQLLTSHALHTNNLYFKQTNTKTSKKPKAMSTRVGKVEKEVPPANVTLRHCRSALIALRSEALTLQATSLALRITDTSPTRTPPCTTDTLDGGGVSGFVCDPVSAVEFLGCVGKPSILYHTHATIAGITELRAIALHTLKEQATNNKLFAKLGSLMLRLLPLLTDQGSVDYRAVKAFVHNPDTDAAALAFSNAKNLSVDVVKSIMSHYKLWSDDTLYVLALDRYSKTIALPLLKKHTEQRIKHALANKHVFSQEGDNQRTLPQKQQSKIVNLFGHYAVRQIPGYIDVLDGYSRLYYTLHGYNPTLLYILTDSLNHGPTQKL